MCVVAHGKSEAISFAECTGPVIVTRTNRRCIRGKTPGTCGEGAGAQSTAPTHGSRPGPGECATAYSTHPHGDRPTSRDADASKAHWPKGARPDVRRVPIGFPSHLYFRPTRCHRRRSRTVPCFLLFSFAPITNVDLHVQLSQLHVRLYRCNVRSRRLYKGASSLDTFHHSKSQSKSHKPRTNQYLLIRSCSSFHRLIDHGG